MIGSASASFHLSDFEPFLHAAIGEDDNDDTRLSVLSALARLDIDPWEEAARLACLPRETATASLTSLIAALPYGRSAQLNPGRAAARLIARLPRVAAADSAALPTLHAVQTANPSGSMSHLILYLVFIVSMLVFQWLIANQVAAPHAAKAAAPIADAGVASATHAPAAPRRP